MNIKIRDKIKVHKLGWAHAESLANIDKVFEITEIVPGGFYVNEYWYYEKEDIKEHFTQNTHPEMYL